MPSLSQCSPSPCLFNVITRLILVILVNGGPVCPPSSSPALPLVKLPVGYYRDVFINAVYGSLSALSLTAFTSSFSATVLLSPLYDIFIFSFLLFSVCLSVSQLSPSSVPSIRFFCPFSPFSLLKSHYFVNFVASLCQRDLICKSHCTELIPNLTQYWNGLYSDSLPILVFRIPQGFDLCLSQGSLLW